MKNRWAIVVLTMCWTNLGSRSFAAESNSIVITLKIATTCEAAHTQIARSDLLLTCDRQDQRKIKYIGARYLGTKPVMSLIQQFERHRLIESVTASAPVHLIQ